MSQPNLSRRESALIQVWVSIVLILIALIMSLTPIITLETGKDADRIEHTLGSILGSQEVSLPADFEVPEKIGITSPDIVRSAKVLIDMFSALTSSGPAAEKKIGAIKEYLETDNGKKSTLIAVFLINTIDGVFGNNLANIETQIPAESDSEQNGESNSDEIGESNIDEYTDGIIASPVSVNGHEDLYTSHDTATDNADLGGGLSLDLGSANTFGGMLEIIFNIMMIMSVMGGVLGLTFALPLIFIVMALTSLISALINIKRPERVAGKIGGKLTAVLMLPLVIMLFQGVVSGMSYGVGAIAIMVISIIAVLFSTLISRFTTYTKEQLTYINIVQGVSVVGLIGFFVFFFNLLKTNVFASFIEGKIFDYIAELANLKDIAAAVNAAVTLPKAHFVDIALIAFYVLCIFTIISYVEKVTKRLSCTSSGSDNLLVYAIMSLPIFIIPKVLMRMAHRYEIDLDGLQVNTDNATSFLKMTEAEEKALTFVLVGIIIMIAAELALIILKRSLCKGMTEEKMKKVISGKLFAVVEAPAAETVAEVASTDEAPAAKSTPIEEDNASQS